VAPFDVDTSMASRMQELVPKLSESRNWAVGAPQYVDETEMPEDSGLDLPVRTVGAVLDLYAKFDHRGERLSKELDRLQLADVETLFAAVSELSRGSGYRIGIAYDGEDIGYIEEGEPDDSIRKGFLEPWNRDLG
jgi:hypothetical protein